MLLLFSVTGPYAMPELWGGGVPTSDNGQFRPRLWVPSPYSLSPTRRSKPTFQWQGTNERIHRQWQQGNETNKGQTRGAPIHSGWVAVTSLLTGGTLFFSEQPGETITQQHENSLLRVGLNISSYLPNFSGFRNRGPEPVTPSIWNTEVFRSDH